MAFTPILQALIEESVVLHRQAIACPRSREISHYEILSRFKEKTSFGIGLGPGSPEDFIKSLEEHDMIHFLDRHVISKAIAHAITEPSTSYAVNLSGATINTNGNFRKFLIGQKAIQRASNIPLIIEITERIAVEDSSLTRSILSFLKAAGCKVAIDDFGAPGGRFDLPSLDLIQPDYLKIDGYYTQRLPDPVAIADINAYCAIAHSRGIKVILEKVEPQHLDIVRDSTVVDLIQGWAIGKPEPLSSF